MLEWRIAGHDDAIALMVACSHPDIQLLGVSTVACNQTVEKTTVNAISVLHACGYGNIPVAQGAPKPLMREHIHCAEIHGDSGLDATGGGHLFPLVDLGHSHPTAALAISDAIRQVNAEGQGPLQLVCTGALTNAALAFMLFPELADPAHVEVTLMGGAMGIGNTGPVQVRHRWSPLPPYHTCTVCSEELYSLLFTPYPVALKSHVPAIGSCAMQNGAEFSLSMQEFNIQTDPEAAHVVFESGVPVAMVPIEVRSPAKCEPLESDATLWFIDVLEL